MKISCKYCGIVSKPHNCPHTKKRSRLERDRNDKKIYLSTRYQNLRSEIFEDYNSVCLWSLYVDGVARVADEAHHIVEILEDESLAYEYDNLIPLEFYIHKFIHKLYLTHKPIIQELLRKMCVDYRNGDKTLKKYAECVHKISPPTY